MQDLLFNEYTCIDVQVILENSMHTVHLEIFMLDLFSCYSHCMTKCEMHMYCR